jgi:hypothetical protein
LAGDGEATVFSPSGKFAMLIAKRIEGISVMKIVCRLIALFGLCFALVACESTYYNAWEQLGVHKRDILVDRIEDTREAQEDTQEQFRDALEQYKAVVNFDGGDLDDMYERFRDEFEASEAAADEVESRIESVADVAEDLFAEWGKELDLYSNASLRSKSQTSLRATKKEYQQLIAAMRKAHASTEPVLSRFRDQVLYLKHNLNARAIASMQDELVTVDRDVDRLIEEMQKSIEEANRFISGLEES